MVLARVVDEVPAELPFGLSDRPSEVDVAVVPDVLDLHEHGVARFPVEVVQPLVYLALVKQTRHTVTDVDEDAELGEPVDRPAVVPTRGELPRSGPAELEHYVLLVRVTDPPVDRRAANDTRTH